MNNSITLAMQGRVQQASNTVQPPPSNHAPTDISLSSSSIAENNAVGDVIGSLGTTDQDSGNTFTYSLVSGTGSTDNASFTITGSNLKAGIAFNYENKSSYSIRVRTTDQDGLYFEKTFTITVTNVDESAAITSPTQTAITDVSATVGATLDCKGLSTVWSIEYGATTGYGSTQAGGTTSVNGAKTIGLTGLSELKSYHWRVKAINSDGTTYSPDQTLTTIETPYINRLNSVLGANLIAYYPTNETSGTTITDSKNGYNGTYGTVVLNQAGVTSARKSFKYGTNGSVDLGVLYDKLDMQNGTVSFFIKPNDVNTWNDSTSMNLFRITGTTANNKITIIKNTTSKCLEVFSFTGGSQNTTLNCGILPTGWVNITITWTPTSIKGYINGVLFNQTNSASKAAWVGVIDQTRVCLGDTNAANTLYFRGNYADIFFASRAMSESELFTIMPLPQIIFSGDSRTINQKWTIESIGNNLITPLNIGWPGDSTTAIATRALTYADPKFRTGLNNISVVWGGVNDGSGQTAQNIYDRLKAFCEARKAVGFKTIVCSEIDCQATAQLAYGWHSTIYPGLNTLLRADHSFADGFADLGANAALQDATNTTYFLSDKTHLKDAGYKIVTTILDPVITSLM